MVKYRARKGERRLAQKKAPRSKDLRDVTTFLHRMPRKGFQQFQQVARDAKNGTVQLPHKVLHGALDDMMRARHPTQLTRGLIQEEAEHKSDPTYHRGGGLWDGFWGVMDTLWNEATSAIEPLAWVQDGWDWVQGYQHSTDVPDDIKLQVDLIGEARKAPGERAKTMNGWTYDESLSTNRVAVYIDNAKKEAHAVVRGTDISGSINTASDISEDLSILAGQKPGGTDAVAKALSDVAQKYGESHNLDVTAYSLGGSQATMAFTDNNSPYAKDLDSYDEIVLVSPGGSPLNTSHVSEIMDDKRTVLLANRSDAISAMYSQHANADQAYYGPHTVYPTYAHQWEQFSSDFDEDTDWKGNEPVISTSAAITTGLAAAGIEGVSEETVSGALGGLGNIASGNFGEAFEGLGGLAEMGFD